MYYTVKVYFIILHYIIRQYYYYHVSGTKKYMQAYQCLIYVTGQVADFSLSTQKLWHLFLPNHIFMPSYTVPYIPYLKEVTPAVLRYESLKIIGFSSYSSSSLHQTISACINNAVMCRPFKIGSTYYIQLQMAP